MALKINECQCGPKVLIEGCKDKAESALVVKDAAELLLSLVTVVISLMVLTMEAIRILTVANKTTWH